MEVTSPTQPTADAIENARNAIEIIADGRFYEDYDESTAALGHLRDLIAALEASHSLTEASEAAFLHELDLVAPNIRASHNNTVFTRDEIMRAFRRFVAMRAARPIAPETTLPQLLNECAAHEYEHTATSIEGLRNRLGEDGVSTDERNALVGAAFYLRAEAARRERQTSAGR